MDALVLKDRKAGEGSACLWKPREGSTGTPGSWNLQAMPFLKIPPLWHSVYVHACVWTYQGWQSHASGSVSVWQTQTVRHGWQLDKLENACPDPPQEFNLKKYCIPTPQISDLRGLREPAICLPSYHDIAVGSDRKSVIWGPVYHFCIYSWKICWFCALGQLYLFIYFSKERQLLSVNLVDSSK